LSEKLGKWHFWLMTPSFLILTLFMMRVGLLGMRRRIADYDPLLNFDFWHYAMTVAAYLIASSVVIFIINVIITTRGPKNATGNVWRSRSPEWQVESPMPVHNYDRQFEVVGEPYDYGLEGSKYVEFIDEEVKHG